MSWRYRKDKIWINNFPYYAWLGYLQYNTNIDQLGFGVSDEFIVDYIPNWSEGIIDAGDKDLVFEFNPNHIFMYNSEIIAGIEQGYIYGITYYEEGELPYTPRPTDFIFRVDEGHIIKFRLETGEVVAIIDNYGLRDAYYSDNPPTPSPSSLIYTVTDDRYILYMIGNKVVSYVDINGFVSATYSS